MQSKIELQSEIDTQNIVKPVSYYKNYMISPLGSVPSQFTQTTNPVITWELPADSLINFSKIMLSFRRESTVTNDTNNNTLIIPSLWNPFVSRIELYTQSQNVKLLDLPLCDVFSKCSSILNNNFLKNSNKNSSILYPKTYKTGYSTTNEYPNSYDAAGDETGKTILSPEAYEESIGSEFGEKYYNYRIGDFVCDSIFNYNKSIYIAKSCFIRITFNNYKKIQGAYVTATRQPVLINSGAYMKVDNFTLKINTENDPLIIEQVKKQSSQGVSYVIPDIISNQYSITGSGVKGIQMKISNISGNNDTRLYKCYSLLSSTGNNADVAKCILPTSNYGNKKYTFLSCFLNSQNILNFDILSGDDTQHMINQHENHSITDDILIKDNGVICNVFDTSPAKNDYSNDEMKGLGFGVSGDITLNWQYTIPAGTDNVISGGTSPSYDNFQFCTVLRRLYNRNGELSFSNI